MSGGYRLPRAGQTDPFAQDRRTGQRREQKGYKHEIECPWESTARLFFGVSQLWIRLCLGCIQSLPWLREVSLSHPCPVSKKTPLAFDKTIFEVEENVVHVLAACNGGEERASITLRVTRCHICPCPHRS